MKRLIITLIIAALPALSNAGNLPPGLQKKVDKGMPLPPGWQKKLHVGERLDDEVFDAASIVIIDEELARVTIKLDGKIIELAEHTHEIIKILDDL